MNLIKQEWNVGYVVDDLTTNVKEPKRKEQLKNTGMKETTSVKRTINRSNYSQKIRELTKQLQEGEETRKEVTAKYSNLQKIHESTKKTIKDVKQSF